MMINVLNPMTLLKGHGIYAFHPKGPTMLRNPPAQHFRSPKEMDIPPFAHDGVITMKVNLYRVILVNKSI